MHARPCKTSTQVPMGNSNAGVLSQIGIAVIKRVDCPEQKTGRRSLGEYPRGNSPQANEFVESCESEQINDRMGM